LLILLPTAHCLLLLFTICYLPLTNNY